MLSFVANFATKIRLIRCKSKLFVAYCAMNSRINRCTVVIVFSGNGLQLLEGRHLYPKQEFDVPA